MAVVRTDILIPMLLIGILLSLTMVNVAHAKLIKVIVIVRIPEFGPFERTDFDDESTKALLKLSDGETTWALESGKKLRELYIRSSRVIPPRYEENVVDIVSAESVRTSQAAQLIGIGLYDRGGERKPVELPPARRLVESEHVLLQSCSADQEDGPLNEAQRMMLREKSAFWSDFKRFFRVRENDDKFNSDPDYWVFESAYQTLHASSGAYRDESLLSRARAIGASAFPREIHPSRLAQEIFHRYLRTGQDQQDDPAMRILVMDDVKVMSDLVSSSTFTLDGATTFPLPRIISIELHDTREIEGIKSSLLIRLLQDFKPATCDEQGNFMCEFKTFLKSPRRTKFSELEWREKCHIGSATTSPTLGTKIPGEDPQSKSLTDENTAAVHGPSGQQASTFGPAPCPNAIPTDDNDDEFIHGFLWGLAIVTTAFVCRCPGKGEQHGAEIERLSADKDPEMHLIENVDNRRFSLEDESGNEYDSKSPHLSSNPPMSSTTVHNSGGSARPSVIAHIPRPKPAVAPSSSPLTGSARPEEM